MKHVGEVSSQITHLLSKKTRAVMPEEISSLLQQSTPSMASHTCGNRGCEHPVPVGTPQLGVGSHSTSSRPLLRPTTMRWPCNSKLQMEPAVLGVQGRGGEPFSGAVPSS